MQTFSAYLVLEGVHPAGRSEQLNFCYFSKFAGDVPLWKIISRDLVDRFGREYACWKGHIVYIQKKNTKMEIYRFSPISGRRQYSVRYIFDGTPDRERDL